MARTKSQHVEPRCTQAELDSVLTYFSLSDVAKERVRKILVEGVAPRVIAQTEKVSTSQVHRQYSKVLKKIEELRAADGSAVIAVARRGRPRKEDAMPALAPAAGTMLVPAGWEAATIVAPSEFIARVRKELNDLIGSEV